MPFLFRISIHKCFCGDDTTDLELYCGDNNCEDVVCDTPCTGDATQICGGLWSMSVYLAGGEWSISRNVQTLPELDASLSWKLSCVGLICAYIISRP